MAGEPLLTARGLSVAFGETRALDGAYLTVERGEIIALLGPSGCGKSTLLRSIAGLQPVDAGEVFLDGTAMAGVAPHRRGMGLMSQTHALFPHRSVADNVAFGLELKDHSSAAIRSRVGAMLDAVGLNGYRDRSIDTLSGGESQRVALARTLAPEPALVMLDEPLGSLDRLLRERLAIDIRTALQAEGSTAIVVTHDQDEAFTIADRIAVMRDGAIVRTDTPVELRRSPGSAFVARFLGMDVVVDLCVDTSGGFDLVGSAMMRPDWPAGSVKVVVPPEAVSVVVADRGQGAHGRVASQPRFRGDHFVTEIDVGDLAVTAHLSEPIPPETPVSVTIDATRLARVEQ